MHASLGGIELQAHSIHHLQTRIIWAIHKTWIRVSQKREQIDFIAIYNPRTRTNKCFVFIELFRRQLLKSQKQHSVLASLGELRWDSRNGNFFGFTCKSGCWVWLWCSKVAQERDWLSLMYVWWLLRLENVCATSSQSPSRLRQRSQQFHRTALFSNDNWLWWEGKHPIVCNENIE